MQRKKDIAVESSVKNAKIRQNAQKYKARLLKDTGVGEIASFGWYPIRKKGKMCKAVFLHGQAFPGFVDFQCMMQQEKFQINQEVEQQ